jgi:hypothetical protein
MKPRAMLKAPEEEWVEGSERVKLMNDPVAFASSA